MLHTGDRLRLDRLIVTRLVDPLMLTSLTRRLSFSVPVLFRAVVYSVRRVGMIEVLLAEFPVNNEVSCTLDSRLKWPPSVILLAFSFICTFVVS